MRALLPAVCSKTRKLLVWWLREGLLGEALVATVRVSVSALCIPVKLQCTVVT